jgi:hypothetical protein
MQSVVDLDAEPLQAELDALEKKCEEAFEM